MHSFKSDHNEVNWVLSVEVDVAGWPELQAFVSAGRAARQRGRRR